MEILEAFDLAGSLRDAAELAGCSHHTVHRYVATREGGGLSDRPPARPQLIDRAQHRPTSADVLHPLEGQRLLPGELVHDRRRALEPLRDLDAAALLGAHDGAKTDRGLAKRVLVRSPERQQGGDRRAHGCLAGSSPRIHLRSTRPALSTWLVVGEGRHAQER